MRIMILIFLLLYTEAGAEQSFLSNDEYAKMLYKNPRGIGCHECHGERGEGKKISSYIKGDKKISLMGPRINNLSIRRFKKALEKGKRLMPEYFLTDQEKAYLYYYLNKQKNIKVVNVNEKK